MGFPWEKFFALTPYATARTTNARSARVSDDIVAGAYQAEAFSRTKRLKPLKAYQSKKIPKKDGNEQERMLTALGITPGEIEEARAESAKLRGASKTLSDEANEVDAPGDTASI